MGWKFILVTYDLFVKQPMAFQFRSAFTNLIVTNLTAKHSIRSNCQDDKGFALLQDVIDIYYMNSEDNEDEFEDDEDIVQLDIDSREEILNCFEDEALVFESANACRNVLLTTKCNACKNTLECYSPLIQHGILKKWETSNGENRILLIRPYYPCLISNYYLRRFELLPFICHEKLLSQKLITSLDSDELVGLGCPEHCADISQKIKKATVKLNIDMFRKDINNILCKKNP